MARQSHIDFSVSPGAYIVCCAVILLLPLRIVGSVFAAAAIHELCHLGALRLLCIPVWEIKIGLGSAVIRTPPIPSAQELLCAAAGPLGSMLCLVFLRNFPLFALCGCMQGLYNLLPVYPLDGGRILRCVSLLLFPRYAHAICQTGKFLAVTVLVAVFVYLLVLTKDFFYILPPFCMMLRHFRK